MKIKEYLKPINIEDAYEHLMDQKKAVLLAGGMFLRLQKRTLPLVIDLAAINLDYIREDANHFKIGAMTTLRSIENSNALPEALRSSARQIAGVSLRNVATIGGSIMGRYPFSDITTALVALEVNLMFHSKKEMKLSEFLEFGLENPDILIEVIVPKKPQSLFYAYKTVYTDFSLVNVAISFADAYIVSIGATPERAKCISLNAFEDIDKILDNFNFSDDYRASGDYRRALAKALLEDSVKEVLKWK